MFEFLRRLRRPALTLDDALWSDTVAALPWARALDPQRRQRLRELTERFLREKTITPVQGLVLEPVHHCMLAALCCLPLLEFGAEGLHGWSQMLVYPEEFALDLVDVDENDVQHEWTEEFSGETQTHGTMAVSWADVVAECEHPHEGNGVVVHEMAHRLDQLDGALDGTPPLPREWQQQWARDFQRAYDAFVAQVEALEAQGEDADFGELRFHPEAADSPDEFFAVMTEYHFSVPALLRDYLPDVAKHLQRLYGPSPFA